MKNLVIPSFRTCFRKDEIKLILENTEIILNTGWLTLGKYTSEFESSFASLTGVKYAIAVNSGTSALEIILRSLKIKKKEVLVPTNTNYATVIAAVNAGFDIKLYDSHLYPCFDDIKNKVTDTTKVLIIVHIGGYITPEIIEIQNFCSKRKIILIEDASHAHESKIYDKFAGSFGLAGAFSFFPTKVMTTCEGGIITTNDENIYKSAKELRDQGKDSNGLHVRYGNSWRLSEIHAAIGLVQIESVLNDNQFRHKIIELYKEKLAKSTLITFPEIPKSNLLSGHKCIAFVKSKEIKQKLTICMKERGIQLGKGVYDVPIHNQPIFKNRFPGKYKRSDTFSSTHICLPIWRTIKSNEVKYIIDNLNLFEKQLILSPIR